MNTLGIGHSFNRHRRYNLNELGTPQAGASLAQRWIDRVSINNGGFISALTQQAVTDLVSGMIIDGTWTKMLVVNGIVPDSLVACMTPILQGPSLGVWPTFGGMTNADVTVNGVTGNSAASKYFNTGFSPNTWASPASTATVEYNFNPTATGFSHGSYNSGGNGFNAAAKFSDNNYKSEVGVVATNLIQGASPGAGYYCRSRVSTTDHRIYFANSGTPHGQLGATDATAFGGAQTGQQMFVLALNNNSAGAQLFASDTISFFAIANGLTSSDSQLIFNRVQAYRKQLGGGFV